jgi:hypothetical protein
MIKTDEKFRLTFEHERSRTRAVCTVTAGMNGIPSRVVVSIRNPDSLPAGLAMQYQTIWHGWFKGIGKGGRHPIPPGWQLRG